MFNGKSVLYLENLCLTEKSSIFNPQPRQARNWLNLLYKTANMNLQIETPALLFGATSLILLAYTNRFLTIATIVRGLKKTYKEKESALILQEIKNLNLRLTLIRNMQMAGVLSLFLSVFAMLLLF